jgi:hypothetical protein
LLLEEAVHVELAGGLVPFPGTAAEHGQPVVGRAAVGLGIFPDIPVALGVGARAAGLEEPGVEVGAVVGHKVDHELDAPAVGLFDEALEVLDGAKQRVDVSVVGDVVAKVSHG